MLVSKPTPYKVKVKLCVCVCFFPPLNEHHTMKAYWGVEVSSTHSYFGTRWG